MVKLERIDTGRRSTVEIDRPNQELLGVGISEGTVNSVAITVLGQDGRSKTIRMAEKIFDRMDSEDVEQNVFAVLNNHQKLKAAGIPTVPTMRLDPEDATSIIMTDLSRGGANDVISIVDWSEYGRGGKFKGSPEVFSLADPSAVSNQLADIFSRACQANLDLNKADVFFLIRRKQNQQARIILGDISKIYFRSGKFIGGDKLSPAEESEIIDRHLITCRAARKTLLESNFIQVRHFIEELNRHLVENSQLDLGPASQQFQVLEQQLKDYFSEEVYDLPMASSKDGGF